MVKKINEEETFFKGLGFCSYGMDGNGSAIDVRDNKIIRIRPLHYDWKYNPKQYNPWKIEARGKTFEPDIKTLLPPISLGYKKRVYSPNRVLHPLKRVDFNPDGERNTENRGKSKYARISWDEALKIITKEITRIWKTYGPYGIFSQGDGHGETKWVHYAHGQNHEFLNRMGGYTAQVRNPDSWEGWSWGARHLWGFEPVGIPHQTNMISEVAQNTDLLIYCGADPETTHWAWSGQIASRLMYWFTELGIKQVFISPDLNYSGAIHGDKWIPIYPNTDAALFLAIAYIWITEDTYDKDYLKTHTVGFDKEKDYISGKEDGIPKTPKWASELCGVPSRIIKALAREWALKKTSFVIGNGGSMIRGPYSTEPARLVGTLLAMQGMGKPGRQFMKLMEWCFFNDPKQIGLPRPLVIPFLIPMSHGVIDTDSRPPKQIIPKDKLADAILHPPITWAGGHLFFAPKEENFQIWHYPMEGCSEIHMIWTDTPSLMTCWNDSNNMVEAFRSPKIEFILAQHPWMENDCLFADIILPVSTKFEENDLSADMNGGQYTVLIDEKRCIEPLGESKSDYEIVCLIAERLGMLDKVTGGKSIEEWKKFGFDGSGVAKLVNWEELKEKGYYVIPTDPDWPKYPPGMREFYENPEKNRLNTPSGKIEIYSQALAEHFPGDEERPPYPKWIPCGETHQESRLCERAKKYPLLMLSNHPRWSVHSQHKDMSWLREIPTSKVKGPDGYLYHPLWIHPADAAKRGISDRDIVSIFNERGIVLCGAYITERIMPGAVSSDHGALYDPIVPGESDRGGANNTICPHNTISKNATGMATSGFLVEVEKANLDELREKYPEAFNRPYHTGVGLTLDRVLEKS